MNTATSRPLVPDDLKPDGRSLVRASLSAALAAPKGINAADLCRVSFPFDRAAAAFLERSSVGGATTADTAALTTRAVAAFLSSLAPSSAAASLISGGMVLPIPPNGSISVPGRAVPPTAAPFVAEGSPIPARSYSLLSALLQPKKIGIIATLTRELALSNAGEAVVATLLVEDASVGLDLSYFSTDDGSAEGHHRGLLAGLTPLAGTDSMSDDLAKLAASVMAAGSGDAVVYIASPGRAAAARVRIATQSSATIPILPSLAVPPDRVIAVDAASLVHGFSGDVEVVGAVDATLHLDTNPTDIGVVGSPAVVAAPGQSLFQAAMSGVRLITDIAFAVRRTGAVAYLDGASW